ncbi:hypothetical protein B0H11DRAFT_2118612 [Mycena galericulata]|nr:hypothetical protein B0H11DRAFT_2118612 [Mycena galericulata]
MHPLGAGCHRAGGVGAGATHPTSHSFSRCFDVVALRPRPDLLKNWPLGPACSIMHMHSSTTYATHFSSLSPPGPLIRPFRHIQMEQANQFHTSTSRSTHHPRTSISLLLGHLPSTKDLRVGTCAFTQRTACGRTRWEIHYQHTYACGTYVIWALLQLSPASGGGRGAMHYPHTYTVGLSQIPSTSKVAT